MTRNANLTCLWQPLVVGVAVAVLAAMLPCSSAACGSWYTATMTSYDNLDGSDDLNPSCIKDYCGTSVNFLSAVPVVAIHQRDWTSYKYRNINIKHNNKTATVQSWDFCSDSDCANNCCTTNADYFVKPGFLLDVERRSVARLFGLTDYNSVFYKVSYQICDSFDPAPIALKYGLKA